MRKARMASCEVNRTDFADASDQQNHRTPFPILDGSQSKNISSQPAVGEKYRQEEDEDKLANLPSPRLGKRAVLVKQQPSRKPTKYCKDPKRVGTRRAEEQKTQNYRH